MAGFEALCFCDARNVGLDCFCAVARLAEDLQVIGLICAAKCERKNVINVPRLAGFDLLGAGCANAFPF
jgi:hypothetical protein